MEETKETQSNLFELLVPYRLLISLLVFFSFVEILVNLFIPTIVSNAIDSFQKETFHFSRIAILLFIASVLIFIFSYIQGIIKTYLAEYVARDLRKEFSNKLSQQSYDFIQKENPSKLLTNLTSDIDHVKLFVSQAAVIMFSSLFMIAGTTVFLLSLNWRLGLPVVVIIALVGFIFSFIIKKTKPYFLETRSVIDLLNRTIDESVFGSALIRVLNAQALEYRKFLQTSEKAKELGMVLVSFFALLLPVIMFVANIAILVILFMGGHFVIQGSMTLGEFVAFNQYVSLLIFPIIMLGFMGGMISQASTSYNRIAQILKVSNSTEDGECSNLLEGNIELKDVQLYDDEKSVLKDISLLIEGGSRTAIIGPTAAGKTRLLYLLSGLVRPDAGEIYFDSIPIHGYKKETFHDQVGLVFQESSMFNLTLRENISFNSSVSQKSLEKALKTAELIDFIDALPHGLDTKIAEYGSTLSGGQKQRIMLARALAIEPKVLLLDDFTARVDPVTEKKIFENIFKYYPHLTFISVTQNIHSVKGFDRIVFLMDGEILALGQHEYLLEHCPEYVQLYNSQLSTIQYEL